MDLGLKDKIVVVLASSKGLGKATATEFAREGAKVFITGRSLETLLETKEEIIVSTKNSDVYPVKCDITMLADIENLRSRVEEQFGRIDVLVNNAGGPPAGGFDDMTDQMWQDSFELNMMSFIRSIREFLPFMKKQGAGHIVNIVSSSTKQTIDNLILSNSFRMGLVGLAKSLARELAADNILINNVGPGRILTDRIQYIDEAIAEKRKTSYEAVRDQNKALIPMGRYGDPAEFAKVIVFLCSMSNTYMTGQSILVDGAMTQAY